MLLHTSPEKDLEKKWKPGMGRFGSGLFFVNGYERSDAYVMTAGDYTVYAITDEIEDDLRIAERRDLDIDEDLLDRLDNFRDAEDSWDAQAELLQLAIDSGYDGVEDVDEQGAVYIIDGARIIDKLIVL